MQLKKIFSLLVLFIAAVTCKGEGGELYQLKTPINRNELKGAAYLTASDNIFRYIPASGKSGILDTLCLQSYAVSNDQTLLVLAESQEQNGKYLNRLIFIDFKNFQFINGIETVDDKKIDRIFFFDNNIVCVKGKELAPLKLGKKLKFSPKKVTLPAEINHFMFFNNNLYIKCRDKSLLKINKFFDITASYSTRDDAGVIFMMPKSQVIANLTDDNIEKIHCLKDGFFRMDFTDLKKSPAPVEIFPSENPTSSLFFLTDKNEIMHLINLSYTEKIDIPDFEQIAMRPGDKDIVLLFSKKYILEIFSYPEFISRKKLSHSTMRPKTDRNLKFIIPHTDGVMLITQQGEFAFIKEQKRRFFKEKLQ